MKKLLMLAVSCAMVGAAYAQDCCAEKKAAKVEAKKSCSGQTMCAEDQFMAEAKKMEAHAAPMHQAKADCCKSTAEKPIAKGEDGCCNAKGETAKFKVFVAGEGYKYFGCAESAAKERKALLAKSGKVGAVQKVQTKVQIH